MSRIAVLHPGQMGSEVARILVESGHDVSWLPAGRSTGTRRRAQAAGLRQLDDVGDRDLVFSICPPAAAVDTARAVQGFEGLYIDANAISPGTAEAVAAIVKDGGARYVDGGIIGPPPQRPGTSRLYLSGSRASEVAAVFKATRLEPVILAGDETAASAVKMTYAAWTKISAALLVSVRDVAEHLGVDDALMWEWGRSQPGLAERHASALESARDKGWRWADEMREIARTFQAADGPAGFGEAAAEVFQRWPRPGAD